MNSNGREIEFRQVDERWEMWVERDIAPFDDYLCGVMRKDSEGFFRFHPAQNIVMHCKLLREAATQLAKLNT